MELNVNYVVNIRSIERESCFDFRLRVGNLDTSTRARLGVCPEEWNVSSPDKVLSIAQAYVGAGSNVIGTNSFWENRFN